MYYNFSQKKRTFKIGLIILVIFLVCFTGYSIKFNRQSTIIEVVIKDSVSKVIDVLSVPFKYLENKWEIFWKSDSIYDDYQTLKKEKELSLAQNNKINELEKENEKLRELLEIKDSILGYEGINATVIYRNVSNWIDIIVIDKGKKDGIDNNMAVMINGGLIGYISDVSNYTSTVTLLTNPNMINKISIRIEVADNKYAYGLLSSYDAENNLYVIEGISEYYDIPVSSKVTTTGLTEKFPGGIMIGNVKSINTDVYDLTKVVMVEPSIDLNDITYVTVLKREATSR